MSGVNEGLSTEDKVIHASCMIRREGYDYLVKRFENITDRNSPEFAKYIRLLKFFVTDSHEHSQRSGLVATLKLVENYDESWRAAEDICGLIVEKCLNGDAEIKHIGMDILRAFVKASEGARIVVEEELSKGLTNSTSKVVVACLESLGAIIRDFGLENQCRSDSQSLTSSLLSHVMRLLEDEDLTVKAATRHLAFVMYTETGKSFKNLLISLITKAEAKVLLDCWDCLEVERRFQA